MTTPLSPDLRNLLARVIRQARRAGEAGARQALESLAVDRARPFETMSLLDKAFRNRLRMHGRQMRDQRDRKTGVQEIGRLAHEVAYEHWHRMLFARFLAENGLLTDPEEGVDLSLEDCRELAREQGMDPWAFAGRCAQRMLPEIFREDDPVLELSLPPETRQELERLHESLPETVFTAPDSLGWTYQFWQAERKAEVNSSGKKIGADELPAVTQLFTERYMVLFLLHNTIGAWRAGKILADRPEVAAATVDEEELRRLVHLETGGGYDFSHLRFVRDVRDGGEDGTRTGPWRPAAGTFPDWPKEASELRVLDPCCGSGHFLVEAFELLVHLRMAEEGFSVEETISFVLQDNLFGLEIDPRCTQIAAFNLALAAWKLVGEPIDLPSLNIACAGLAPVGSKDAWVQDAERIEDASGLALERDLFGRDPSLVRGPLQEGMAALYELFKRGPELGSLLDPESIGSELFRADFKSLRELLESAVEGERRRAGRDERTIAAAGMARAAEILQGRYTLVVTNVPFLGRKRQDVGLAKFAVEHHDAAKGDIATVFVSRIFGWLDEWGTQGVVSPQSWLTQETHRAVREQILKRRTWNLVAWLGSGAFETISGEVVKPTLAILSARRVAPELGKMVGVDVSAAEGKLGATRAAEKGRLLRGAQMVMSTQDEQLRNPDSRVLLRPVGTSSTLSLFASYGKGSTTGDKLRFLLRYWEFDILLANGVKWLDSPTGRSHWTGRSLVLKVSLSDLELLCMPGCWLRGGAVLGRPGVAVRKTGRLCASIYDGEIFDDNVGVVAPNSEGNKEAVFCYCDSSEYPCTVGKIDKRLNSTSTLVKVPFDLEHWKKVATEQYPNGLPEPYSDDPTQWIFHGDPSGSVIWDGETKRTASGPLRIDGTVLQVAVARLLGYRWPAELDSDMRLAPEQREAAEYCREFAQFADADGIACLSAARGESNAADRLRDLLAAAYDKEWSAATERALLAATGPKPPRSLEGLAPGPLLPRALQALPQPAVRLAHLGRSQGRLPCARQLPPACRGRAAKAGARSNL